MCYCYTKIQTTFAKKSVNENLLKNIQYINLISKLKKNRTSKFNKTLKNSVNKK